MQCYYHRGSPRDQGFLICHNYLPEEPDLTSILAIEFEVASLTNETQIQVASDIQIMNKANLQ